MKNTVTGGEKAKDVRGQSVGRVICVDIKITKNYDRHSVEECDNDPGNKILKK